MRDRFQPRQTEKTAAPLDGVNETKNIIYQARIVRHLFKPHNLDIEGRDTF
jgi:hypothetical protein